MTTDRVQEVPRRILVVAPSETWRTGLSEALSKDGVEAERIEAVAQAAEAIDAGPYEIAVVSWRLPGGPELVRRLTADFSDVPVIALAAAEVTEAVAAMQAGAADVLTEPVDEEALRASVGKVLATATGGEDVPPEPAPAGGLIGESRPMKPVHDMIRRAAPGEATVLIRGESGTGKELVARAIHEQSPRRDRTFVKVHCAALPDTLLESELFGHEKGAFTGATARKPGRVEVADGGTLFLDEIGDVTPVIQVKLLRLLQDREYEPLGSSKTRKANVRFIAATHRNLESMIKNGEFREDLFYRLNVLPLWLPPLRARRDDVELLAKHFCKIFGERNDRPNARLGDDAIEALRRQRWAGNVRQLQNLVERLVILAAGDGIARQDVERELSQNKPFSTQATAGAAAARTGNVSLTGSLHRSQIVPLSEEIRAAEKKALVRALEHAKGNRTLAARILGISRATLYNKLTEYGLV